MSKTLGCSILASFSYPRWFKFLKPICNYFSTFFRKLNSFILSLYGLMFFYSFKVNTVTTFRKYYLIHLVFYLTVKIKVNKVKYLFHSFVSLWFPSILFILLCYMLFYPFHEKIDRKAIMTTKFQILNNYKNLFNTSSSNQIYCPTLMATFLTDCRR